MYVRLLRVSLHTALHASGDGEVDERLKKLQELQALLKNLNTLKEMQKLKHAAHDMAMPYGF